MEGESEPVGTGRLQRGKDGRVIQTGQCGLQSVQLTLQATDTIGESFIRLWEAMRGLTEAQYEDT